MQTLSRRVSFTLTAATACVSLLGAGCSNNPYPPGETAANTHTVNFGEDPKSLDPTFSFTTTESLVVDSIYPSYFRYHYLHQQPVRLIPNLGANDPVRRPLPDGGEEWTFTIRRDLRFQDDPCFPGGKGRPVVANDFVYSFQRMADPKGEFPLAGILEDKVVGWKPYSAAFRTSRSGFADPNFDRPLPGVQVDPADPFTFRIRLTQPYPQLRFLMAMHFTTPQAREAVERYNDQYRFHPVGCGPYTLAQYTPKQRLVLRRNPNHAPTRYPSTGDPGDREAGLLEDAGRPLPLVDTIVLNLIRESTSTWNLFLQGYLDETSLNSNNFQQAMAPGGQLSPRMKALGIRMRRTPQSAVYYLAFNMRDPEWGGNSPSKRKLRQAVALSVDADEYIDLALQGNGIPAQWMFPVGIAGHDPAYRHPYRTTDIERAKALLADAGYPGGKDPRTGARLVLNLDSAATTAAGRTSYGILQRQIERIGIKVEHRATPANQFRDKLLKVRHQCILYGWFADYPDPENFAFLLHGPTARPGSPNYAQYQNSRYDRLFEQVRAMDDSPERLRLLEQMRDIAAEDCAWVPVYHPVAVSLTHQWVRNTKSHPIAYDVLGYRRIDNTTRAKRIAEWNRPVWWPLAAAASLTALGIVNTVNVARRRSGRRLRATEAPR